MTWVKLDDTCPDHPAIVGLSDAAFACWVRCLCYSSRHLTDGFIPENARKTLGKPSAFRELSTGNRLEKIPGGWRVHGYEERQRTRAQVDESRAQWRERQQRHRGSHAPVTPESRRDTPVSHGRVTPLETEESTETEKNDLTYSRSLNGVVARLGEHFKDETIGRIDLP